MDKVEKVVRRYQLWKSDENQTNTNPMFQCSLNEILRSVTMFQPCQRGQLFLEDTFLWCSSISVEYLRTFLS